MNTAVVLNLHATLNCEQDLWRVFKRLDNLHKTAHSFQDDILCNFVRTPKHIIRHVPYLPWWIRPLTPCLQTPSPPWPPPPLWTLTNSPRLESDSRFVFHPFIVFRSHKPWWWWWRCPDWNLVRLHYVKVQHTRCNAPLSRSSPTPSLTGRTWSQGCSKDDPSTSVTQLMSSSANHFHYIYIISSSWWPWIYTFVSM